MYLLVFVTLIIGLLGVYAQILSLQAERLAESQTGLARVMMVWHTAAVSMAASVLDTQPAVTIPCSLTFTVPPGSGLAKCEPPVDTATGNTVGNTGTVTDATNNPNSIFNTKTVPPQVETVHLPNDYNAAQYQFYSVLYRDATSNAPYVISFVTPPVVSIMNPAPGLISLPPTNAMIGFSLIDLRHQLQVAGVPGYAYGTVNSSNSLITPDLALNIEYNNLPISVPSGAVAVVSSPSGF